MAAMEQILKNKINDVMISIIANAMQYQRDHNDTNIMEAAERILPDVLKQIKQANLCFTFKHQFDNFTGITAQHLEHGVVIISHKSKGGGYTSKKEGTE